VNWHKCQFVTSKKHTHKKKTGRKSTKPLHGLGEGSRTDEEGRVEPACVLRGKTGGKMETKRGEKD